MINNALCQCLHLILLLLLIFCMVIPYIHKREKSDEMSEANMAAAHTFTSRLTPIFLILISSALRFTPSQVLSSLDLSIVLPGAIDILIGIHCMAIGLAFKHYEAEEE